MRKIHVLCMALFAVFALSSVFASMSAAAEWLVDELPITELLSVETIGELVFEVLNEPLIGTVSILCSGILDGTISPSGLDEVTELLTLGGGAVSLTALTGTALECTNVSKCTGPVLVWADGLPWQSELISVTDDLIIATEIGVYIQCMGIIGEPSDLCSQKEVLATLSNMLELPSLPDDVLAETTEVDTMLCINSGEPGSIISSDGAALIQVLEGKELAVS